MRFVVDFNSNAMLGENLVLIGRQGTLGAIEQQLRPGLLVMLTDIDSIDSLEVDAVVELISFLSYTAWVGRADWSTCRDL